MNPSRDHHLVLVVVQVAPDLFSFRDNQTQWGHTHCCQFLEPDSDASFASCLEALVVRGTWYWPTLIIQLPRVAWLVDRFSTCFWLNVAVLVCMILPALKTKFLYYDSLFFLPLCWLPFHYFLWFAIFPLLLSHILTLGLPPFGSEPPSIFSFERRRSLENKGGCWPYFLKTS